MFNDIIQHSCFGKPLYEPSVTLKNAKSSIERFYDEQGNETEKVVMKVESGISGVWIEQGQYHSLEAKDEMGLCLM